MVHLLLQSTQDTLHNLDASLKIAAKKIQAVQAYFCEDGKKVKVEDIMKQMLAFAKQLTLVMKVCGVWDVCV